MILEGKAETMGLLRGLARAVGGLLAGVFGLLKGVITGLGSLLRRLFSSKRRTHVDCASSGSPR
jgi:hypothetical protein